MTVAIYTDALNIRTPTLITTETKQLNVYTRTDIHSISLLYYYYALKLLLVLHGAYADVRSTLTSYVRADNGSRHTGGGH